MVYRLGFLVFTQEARRFVSRMGKTIVVFTAIFNNNNNDNNNNDNSNGNDKDKLLKYFINFNKIFLDNR